MFADYGGDLRSGKTVPGKLGLMLSCFGKLLWKWLPELSISQISGDGRQENRYTFHVNESCSVLL